MTLLSANEDCMTPSMTHLCLVGEQPVPNLTPALARSLGEGWVPADRVVLLASARTLAVAGRMAEVLRRHGLTTMIETVDDAWDLAALRRRVRGLLAAWRGDDAGALMVNATGGTKMMMLAATVECLAAGLPAFYVHPEANRLRWIAPEGRADSVLDQRLGLDDFLAAHGVALIGGAQSAVAGARVACGRVIVTGRGRFQGPLKTVNAVAAQGGGAGALTVPLTSTVRPGSTLAALWSLFAQAGCVSIVDDRAIFPDETARIFVNGGWLEEWVHAAVQDLAAQCGIHGSARSVRFRWSNGVENEFDVVFLVANRLYVLECKSGDLANSADVNAILYKADSLVRHMGSQARRMLVSLHPIGANAARRARNMDLDVVSGDEVSDVRAHLLRWISRR